MVLLFTGHDVHTDSNILCDTKAVAKGEGLMLGVNYDIPK